MLTRDGVENLTHAGGVPATFSAVAHGAVKVGAAGADADGVRRPAVLHSPYASGGTQASARKASPSAKYGCHAHEDFAGDERDQRSHLAWMRLWLA